MSRTVAVRQAQQDYATYAVTYNSPPYGVMVRTGLWVELEVLIVFAFGLGFASLLGQRMVPILLMIVYEIIFRPFLLHFEIPHLINLQRVLVFELAVAHFEPAGIGVNFGIVNGPGGIRDSSLLVSESTTFAGLCDNRVASGLDGSRGMADGDQGRVRNTASSQPPRPERKLEALSMKGLWG